MWVIGTGVCVDDTREDVIGARLLKAVLLAFIASNECFEDLIFRPLSQ